MKRVTMGLVCLAALCALRANAAPVAVGTFPQDAATVFTAANGLPSDNARAVAVTAGGVVFAATDAGLAEFDGTAWKKRLEPGAVHALTACADGVAVAIGDSIYQVQPGGEQLIAKLPDARIYAMAAAQDGTLYVGTSKGLYKVAKRRCVLDRSVDKFLQNKKHVLAVAVRVDGTVAIGTADGLFRKAPGQLWTVMIPSTEDGKSWALRDVKAVAFDKSGELWFGSPQGAGRFDGGWTLYAGPEGLPYNGFTGAAGGPNGEVWFATDKGAMRFEADNWNYRQGRRWVPNDDVRAVAVGADGSAWFATAGGVGVIKRQPMTLAEKAVWYEDEIDKYNRRTEYQYVLEASLANPGDKSKHSNQDSDNDGLWTAMYGAGECFAYGATKDEKAKARAKQAFEALRFLSVAPVDGEVKQQPGFVARTVVPTTEKNPNEHAGYTLEGQQKEQKDDILWKAYSPRWPLTKDKKYWYKTDTSSDELDGHYFFYGLYHDLAADTEEEKERVRDVVRGLTDHLLRNDFCLIDHDGTPTRWAVYSPAKLNHESLWSWERGLNSLSILSYLTTAEHMTGDAKYTKAITMLREKYAFDTNAIVAKLQQGMGSGNHSDDEMAVMCFYNIVKYTKDENLKKLMTYAFYRYMSIEWPEMNPFFNFSYAAVGQGATFRNAFNDWKIDPWDGWLEDSVDTLKRFPLDRIDWAHHNSHRLDLLRLPRAQHGDPVEPWEEVSKRQRGYRVNGKVLPVDERHFNHWNTDPWTLNYGGDGKGLADGAVFLLPYYMGLYHGFISN